MTSTPPPMDPDHIRIGNADREQVVRRLNDAFAEGRLEVHELDERVAAAYAAKTLADLRPLTADLPGGAVTPPAPRSPVGQPYPIGASPSGQPAQRRGFPAAAYRGLITAVAINVVIWAVVSISTGHLIYFWPIWVAVPLLIALISHVVGGGWRSERERERWERRQQRRDRRGNW